MKKSLLSLAVITALSSSLLASDVRVGGFVNVVGGINDVKTTDTQQDLIRGYDDKYDFTNESLAAVQFNGSISDNMGATVQLIAQQQAAGDNIRMEWGYISYDATDELRILAGRVRPALFLFSDYLDVGYAYTWITPPSEVYYQAQITNLDGVSATYNMELGDNQLSLNVYGGNTKSNKLNPSDGTVMDFSFDSIVGTEIAFSNDYAKLRAGYIQASVTNTNANFGAAPQPAIDALGFDESSASFYSIGLNVDYEDLLFATEFIGRDMDETVAPDSEAYYAMIGYRIGDFTPNYTYAAVNSTIEVGATGTAQVDGMINTMRAAQLDDRISHTIGLRYEVNAQAALKLEYNMATVTTTDATLAETDADINTMRVALNVTF